MRARKFPSGLRQRLRLHIRACGVEEKFSTDLLRDGSLVVRGLSKNVIGKITNFENYKVRFLSEV